MFDLTPLINQVKEFNQTQILILQELQTIHQLLKHALNSKEPRS
jgi:hypothetical protein